MTGANAETLFTRSMAVIDRAVPATFQLIEWLLVVSALRWAADATDSSFIKVIALGSQLLLAIYVTRRLGAAGLLAFPGFEAHGQPLRLAAAWISAMIGALIMANLATTTISHAAKDLFVLNDAAEEAAAPLQAKQSPPPSFPPETSEKTVNIAGGQ